MVPDVVSILWRKVPTDNVQMGDMYHMIRSFIVRNFYVVHVFNLRLPIDQRLNS